MRKFDDKELRRRVDEVLFYVWDPIGVSDEPCARGEYWDYVSGILAAVEKFDEPEPIGELLAAIVTEQIGISPNRTHCKEVASLLLRHKHAIQDGIA